MQGKTLEVLIPMKRNFLHASVLAAGLFLMSVPVVAHHGDAGRYDETPFIVTGTLVEIKLTNPHSILVFDVTDPSGKVVRWQAEMGGGQQLTRQFGWNKESPKIGDKITLNGRKVKSGAPYMNMTEKANIILTDTGKEIFKTPNFGEPAPTPPPAKP
jgi:hypothetical protein